MRKALLLALCAGVLVASASPAVAQQYPPNRPPTCNAQDHTPSPGQANQFGGKFWKPGSTVDAGFHQQSTDATVLQENLPVGANGQWATVIVTPNDVENGPAVYGAKGLDRNGNPFNCIVNVTVVGASAAATASASSPAGITVGTASLVALAMFGAWLVLRNRQRTKKLVA
jgi:hypothetical protein